MSEATLAVVRALGSNRCHVARIAADDWVDATYLGASCQIAALDPVSCICSAKLHYSRGAVVRMHTAKVSCRTCANLTGITEIQRATP